MEMEGNSEAFQRKIKRAGRNPRRASKLETPAFNMLAISRTNRIEILNTP